jgi:hypothetical protein
VATIPTVPLLVLLNKCDVSASIPEIKVDTSTAFLQNGVSVGFLSSTSNSAASNGGLSGHECSNSLVSSCGIHFCSLKSKNLINLKICPFQNNFKKSDL